MAMSADTRSSIDPTPSWLFGRTLDLLLGAGCAYLISVVLILLIPGGLGPSRWPGVIVWTIAIGINGAHYGATLLRVYENRAERRKYAIFSVWLTLAVFAAFVVGVYDVWAGSALVTLYITWSPWHFAGQNYGIALMFLRRSGVEVDGVAKRLLYASFALSFVLAFLALHVEGSTNVFAPTRSGYGLQLELLRLGIPRGIAVLGTLVGGLAYLLCLGGALVLLWRQAGIAKLFPVIALSLCQALWFAVPAWNDVMANGIGRGLALAAIWISAAHSLQYLWISRYFDKQRRSERGRASGLAYLTKTLLVGNAVFVVPGIVFAGNLLGSRSWNEGLGLLTFAVVNVHHFMLDGAIWKLRDGTIARALLRNVVEPDSPGPNVRTGRYKPLVIALWMLGLACLAVEVGDLVQRRAERAGATALASAVLDGLAIVGRDQEGARIRLGRAALRRHSFQQARHEFEMSVASRPSVAGYAGIGRAMEGLGELLEAAKAYESGLALAPEDSALLNSAAWVRLELGQPQRAKNHAMRALEDDPNNANARKLLERANRMLDR